MNNILYVLLALFGAAFLGSVIGWCARRIVALKDERYLVDQHTRSLQKLDNSLQDSEAARQRSLADVARLEKQVGEMDVLNETLAASESDLAELRSESAGYQQRLDEKDEAIRKANNELQTQKLIARNAENEKQLMLERTANQVKANSGLQRNRISANRHAVSAPAAVSALPESVKPEAYRLASLYDDDAELEIDSDIADMTADISALLDEEERQIELSAKSAVQPLTDTVAARNTDSSHDASANKEINSSADIRKSTPMVASEKNEVATTPVPATERRGLFSAFNRKKKH